MCLMPPLCRWLLCALTLAQPVIPHNPVPQEKHSCNEFINELPEAILDNSQYLILRLHCLRDSPCRCFTRCAAVCGSVAPAGWALSTRLASFRALLSHPSSTRLLPLSPSSPRSCSRSSSATARSSCSNSCHAAQVAGVGMEGAGREGMGRTGELYPGALGMLLREG